MYSLHTCKSLIVFLLWTIFKFKDGQFDLHTNEFFFKLIIHQFIFWYKRYARFFFYIFSYLKVQAFFVADKFSHDLFIRSGSSDKFTFRIYIGETAKQVLLILFFNRNVGWNHVKKSLFLFWINSENWHWKAFDFG